MLDVLLKEIESRKEEILSINPETIYLGGGTPSILSETELMMLFDEIDQIKPISTYSEITLEANPDDLNPDYLNALTSTPINRLSIGIQSFKDEDLCFMNRSHTARQALEAVENAQNNGFTNLSIDLIYGSPTTTHDDWMKNLEIAQKLNISHLSTYCLTVEDNTALHHQIQTGKRLPLDDDKSAQQFKLLQDYANSNGWNHYEISNLCRPGYESKHNSAYWEGAAYVGIGPGAHSFDGQSTRRINKAHNIHYIKSKASGRDYYEFEKLSKKDRINEVIITQLRRKKGMSKSYVIDLFGHENWLDLLERSSRYKLNNQIIETKNSLLLNPEVYFISDTILVDLIIE